MHCIKKLTANVVPDWTNRYKRAQPLKIVWIKCIAFGLQFVSYKVLLLIVFCRALDLQNTAHKRQDLLHYSLLLKDLKRKEENYNDDSKVVYFMQVR